MILFRRAKPRTTREKRKRKTRERRRQTTRVSSCAGVSGLCARGAWWTRARSRTTARDCAKGCNATGTRCFADFSTRATSTRREKWRWRLWRSPGRTRSWTRNTRRMGYSDRTRGRWACSRDKTSPRDRRCKESPNATRSSESPSACCSPTTTTTTTLFPTRLLRRAVGLAEVDRERRNGNDRDGR